MGIKDDRVKVTNEVFSSMKIIKLYAWEDSYGQRVRDIRDSEMHWLARYMKLYILNNLFWSSIPVFVALATFATFTLTGHELTASRAFTSLALFDMLRFPMAMFPSVINNIVEASVS